jgi:hypothetical protein
VGKAVLTYSTVPGKLSKSLTMSAETGYPIFKALEIQSPTKVDTPKMSFIFIN